MYKRWWARVTVLSSLAFIVLTIPIALRRNWPGDMGLVEWALAMRRPGWTAVMQAVTFMGSFAVGVGLCAGMSAALWARCRRLDRRVCLPLVAIAGSAPLNAGLRIAFARVRPDVAYIPDQLPALTHPFQRWSYPSGHAMTATICYGLLLYLLVCARPRLARWLAPCYVLWLAAIGFSRVYLGVHWPTDVLAGYMVGGFWLSVCGIIGGVGSTLRRRGLFVLINRTTGQSLALHVQLCATFWRRLRGLTFRRRIDADEAFVFSAARESIAESTIHMLGVFFPIAVLWLDGQRRVVDATLARPFRPYYAPRRPAQHFVEGAPGLLDQVHVGDELDWEMG